MVKMQMLTAVMLLAACMLGCARGPGPTIKRFYQGLAEPLDGLDVSGLRGRTIVLDPGHGGIFRGARGVGGLDEADVNLGVALHLKQLLENAGARVVLTRDADLDFVDGDSLRLRDDLRARVALSNAADPDLLISLHHNADLKPDPAFNEIQVYYKLSDDGPSLDAARSIATHLARNLGEEKARLIGGNYHVLRNSSAPAVLCEPSFISNPEIETCIKLDEKQRLEAAAYFLGLAEYFSRGIPEVVALGPLPASSARGLPSIEIAFDDGSPMDASSVEVRLDGTPLDVRRTSGNRFLALPGSPLASGRHILRARGKSAAGNWSREAVHEFQVRLEPQWIAIGVEPDAGDGVHPQKVTATVLDRNGNPVADSTAVVFSWNRQPVSVPTRSGRASVYAGRELPFNAEVAARCGSIEAATGLSPARRSEACYVSGFISEAGGKAVDGATVTAVAGDPQRAARLPSVSATSDGDGFFVLQCDRPPTALKVSRRGFRAATSTLDPGRSPSIVLQPLYADLGPGTLVAIDAAGGSEARERLTPSGFTLSDLNLAVARRLGRLLESVGVGCVLTRDSGSEVTQEDRVRLIEAAGATLLISISHSTGDRPAARIGHYPNSTGGARVSRLIGQDLALLGYDAQVGETADYMVQQPGCVAVSVELVEPAGFDGAAPADPRSIWLRAYAIMCSVLKYLGVDEAAAFSITGTVTQSGKACPGALVIVDGTLEVPTDAAGSFSLRLLERGGHTAEAIDPAGASRIVEFNEETDHIWINVGP